jgi:hypothetical protein
MAPSMTLDELRIEARRAGLDLSDEELQRLLPGVNRAKQQAVELREIVATEDEPATNFGLSKTRHA